MMPPPGQLTLTPRGLWKALRKDQAGRMNYHSPPPPARCGLVWLACLRWRPQSALPGNVNGRLSCSFMFPNIFSHRLPLQIKSELTEMIKNSQKCVLFLHGGKDQDQQVLLTSWPTKQICEICNFLIKLLGLHSGETSTDERAWD